MVYITLYIYKPRVESRPNFMFIVHNIECEASISKPRMLKAGSTTYIGHKVRPTD